MAIRPSRPAASRSLDAIATELYFGYRYHYVSRNDADFDPINAVLSGARLRF